jgi:type II secretory pathway component GspD/PulD (secretin)
VESGTILEISPVVHDSGVDVDLFQQVSSFVSTGAGTQPTLNKRELRTSLTVQDGKVAVIAGLDETKDDDTRSGLSFLPFSLSKSRSTRRSQLVLVMQLQRLM